MDEALAPVVHPGHSLRITRDDVESLVSSGDTGRVVALASMVGHPEITEGEVVVHSIVHSASRTEQYYALLAARAAWQRLDEDVQRRIPECIDGSGPASRYIADDPYRVAVARDIVRRASAYATR